MYDSIATLKKNGPTSRDRYGNVVDNISERTVYVQARGVYSSEFYNAAQLGLRPTITLYISTRADYQGEKVLEFESREYSVIRVDWNAQRDGVALICEERARNELDD